MIAGGYELHLYCDNARTTNGQPDIVHRFNEFPHQYTHELGSVCRRNARADGWRLMPDGRALCPKCRKVPWPATIYPKET